MKRYLASGIRAMGHEDGEMTHQNENPCRWSDDEQHYSIVVRSMNSGVSRQLLGTIHLITQMRFLIRTESFTTKGLSAAFASEA
jgi:hypothetical protein